MTDLNRRHLMGVGLLGLTPGLAWATVPASRRLAFAVYRDGVRIGDHLMTFAGDPDSPTVSTDVTMLVKVGPVPVFRYHHRATERWAGGRFASIETTTTTNGKTTKVTARRAEGAVLIEAGKVRTSAPAASLPLTHWNPDALAGPLFNPQDGKVLKVSTGRRTSGLKLPTGKPATGTLWTLRGDAEIEDWYDEAGTWLALRSKLKDGSVIDYRRL